MWYGRNGMLLSLKGWNHVICEKTCTAEDDHCKQIKSISEDTDHGFAHLWFLDFTQIHRTMYIERHESRARDSALDRKGEKKEGKGYVFY